MISTEHSGVVVSDVRPPLTDFAQGDLSDFPREEFVRRWSALSLAMSASNIDGLIITSETNYRYVTGHATQFWLSKSRPMIAVLMRDQAPELIIPSNQEIQARRTSFADITVWEGAPLDALKSAAQCALSKAERRRKPIVFGMELGNEQRLGISYLEFEALRRELGSAEVVDAADIFWNVRAIKSPLEIAYLKQSSSIVGTAYDEAFEMVKAGNTEHDVHKDFVARLFANGAERQGYVPVTSGASNYWNRTGGPTQRALRVGDLLWFDGGCLVKGYWSDSARMIAIGEPTNHQRNCYRAIRSATHDCLSQAKAGITASSLFDFCFNDLELKGLRLKALGRIGHGIGLDLTETPSLSPTDRTILQPGMVITIEPTYVDSEGLYQLEEVFVVGENGAEIITRPAPPELPVTLK